MNYKKSGYIKTLDGWRAVAILAVLVAHGGYLLLGTLGVPPSSPLYSLLTCGSLGVDLFFAISGFLICSRLLEEYEVRGQISLGSFYIRRMFRILPPCLLLLAVLAFLAMADVIHMTKSEWLSGVFFYRNYLRMADGGWFTGHLWSLAVEEHFYLLWPGLLVLLAPKRALWAGLILCVVIAGWRVYDFRFHLFGATLDQVSFFERTDIRLDALLWGCVAALGSRRWFAKARFWRSGYTPWILLALFVACTIWKPTLALVWQSILLAALVMSTTLATDSKLGRFLELPGLRYIGQLSYSLYLWQQMFLNGAGEHVSQPLALLQTAPLNFFIMLACAVASYYLLERPMIRIGHRLARPVTPGRDNGPAVRRPHPAADVNAPVEILQTR